MLVFVDYADTIPIEEFVKDTAVATNRGLEKANEWCAKLKSQDIMNVGDLRGLHDEDWSSIGLTVFASRSLKNALHGRLARAASLSGAGGNGLASSNLPTSSLGRNITSSMLE